MKSWNILLILFLLEIFSSFLFHGELVEDLENIVNFFFLLEIFSSLLSSIIWRE